MLNSVSFTKKGIARVKILALGFSLALFFEGYIFVASAQSVCPSVFTGLSKAQLEEALVACQKEIDSVQGVLNVEKQKSATFASEIATLNAKISKAQLEIKKRNAGIEGLTSDISVKSKTIDSLSVRIENEKQSLAQLIKKTEEIDSYSLAEVVLSDKKISDFFGDLDSFQFIQDEISESLVRVSDAKTQTEEQKKALEEKKNKEIDLRKAQEVEKKRIEANEAEKQRLLKVTKGNEAAYQKDLKEKQKRAAEIRATLFALRDTGEIPFGKALDYANIVSKSTGIRPAFLLAIFQQESGFGKSQGSCFLKDPVTGSGVGKNTGTPFSDVMKPTRDVAPFLDLMQRLGRDPYTTPVSCPQTGGYGGAMGPAQFIPSTWILFEKRIERALGIETSDPWFARDAFMAAGIYLTDLGARPDSYTSERNAACRYFSGKKCADSSWASTYGSQVMSKAEVLQATIDSLNGN
jgi:membrane-bound lytic murein transglycosylase B